MKNRLLFIICFLSTLIKAQVEPSVTFDSVSGNYIIEYMGYVGEEQTQTLVREIFEPSTKIHPSVRAFISCEDSVLRYNYYLVNGKNSIQRLQTFNLDVYANLKNVSSPDRNWKFRSFSFVPVSGWDNSKDPSGLNNPMNGIAPDSSVGGFSFTSYSLPTIVKAYFQGNQTIYLSYPDEGSEEITEMLIPLIRFPNNTVIRPTISPQSILLKLTINEFLDSLTYFSRRSFELGWITNEHTKTKYEDYLNSAKNALSNNDSSAARTYLQNVLNDVETDSSSTLSSEAYALLRYNTDYLLVRLGVPEGE